MLQALNNLVQLIANKPWAIFILFTLVFSYLYFDQNKQLNIMTLEVGGLRVEQQKMNEIIALKVQLAEANCNDAEDEI